MRIGSATAAVEAGIPMKIIKAMGRWSSDRLLLQLHTHPAQDPEKPNWQTMCIIRLHEQVHVTVIGLLFIELCDPYLLVIDAFPYKKKGDLKITLGTP